MTGTQDRLLRLRDLINQQGILIAEIGEILAELILEGKGDEVAVPTIYGQRDMPWAPLPLGKATRYTVYSSGCLMCAYASCVTDSGQKMDPMAMNAWLTANDGFTADRDGQIVNFIFSRGDKLGVLKFDGLTRCEKTAAPVAAIEKYVETGYVLVMVHRAGVPQHWVRYLGNGQIMDPWYGDIAPLLPRYIGRTLGEAILAVAYYKPAAKG